MATEKASLEDKLLSIQHVVVLAAWIEDARRALNRLEEIRELNADVKNRLAELNYLSPMDWCQEESEALVGIMQIAERACRKAEEFARPAAPRLVGGAAAPLIAERGGAL